MEDDLEDGKTVVLAVDDNDVNLLILVNLLKKHFPFEVLSAKNGKEAVEMVSNTPISAVFMDCDMPVMDGLEATKQIRQLNDSQKRNMPIIAITANVSAVHQKACLDAGMTSVLTKPVDVQKIKFQCASFYRAKSSV